MSLRRGSTLRAFASLSLLLCSLHVHAALVLATGSLAHAREAATTTLLQDGRVMMAGGVASPTTTASIEIFDPATGTFADAGSMIEPRENAVAVPLPNGRVLIAGGDEAVGSFSTLASAEQFDPASGFSASIGTMVHRRHNATATLLADGTVLIAGGTDSGSGGVDGDPGAGPLAAAEIYDPVTNAFTPTTGGMSVPRSGASATLLADGRVLIVGGYGNDSGPDATADVYNPAAGTFAATPAMPGGGRAIASATLLPDGRVLIAGGNGYSPASGSTIVASAVLYDPVANNFQTTGSLANPRTSHGAVLLGDGRVLIAGGIHTRFAAAFDAELYDPASGTFAPTTGFSSAHAAAGMSVLADGSVLLVGGILPPPDNNSGLSLISAAERYDPARTTPSATGALATARESAMTSLLADGRVLVAGGLGTQGDLASAEVFDPATASFGSTGSLTEARHGGTSTLLPNGKVLVAGGRTGSGTASKHADLYDVAAGTFVPHPSGLRHARSDASSVLLPNGRLLIVGGDDDGHALSSAEIYDWYANAFRGTGPMVAARFHAGAVLLPNGTVLVVGGEDDTAALASAELYDPQTRTFHATGSMNVARAGAVVALLPSGNVLVMGGRNDGSTYPSAELYDPSSETFTSIGDSANAGSGGSSVVLPGGQVLIAGNDQDAGPQMYESSIHAFIATDTPLNPHTRGSVALLADGRVLLAGGNDGDRPIANAELYERHVGDGIDGAQKPFLAPFADAHVDLPFAFDLGGSGFRGSHRIDGSIAGGEGSAGGSASSSPSNLPLLQLTRIDNQRQFFQPSDSTLPWTDALFSTPMLGRFDPQAQSGVAAGHYRFRVIANGIASDARTVSAYWLPDDIYTYGFESED